MGLTCALSHSNLEKTFWLDWTEMPETKELRKAIILVGGEGTRLRPLTNGIPKPMLPILNRPFLEYTIAYLKKYHLREIILTVGYLPGVIQDYFGDGSRLGIRLHYALEDSPLGTAGAVKNTEHYLDNTFVVLNGDIFTDLNIADMFAFHQQKKSKATIALFWADNPCAFGVVETERDGRVRQFIEKPSPDEAATNWINAGIYIIEPELLQYVPKDTHYMFERGLFPRLLELGEPVYGYKFSGQWLDMGTPEKYLRLNCDLLLADEKPALVGSPNEDGLYCAEDAVIHHSAQITGPVIIANRSRIGPRARIRGPVVIGPDCNIGDGAVLETSVLWHGVTIGSGAVLKKCVVGNDTKIGTHQKFNDCVMPPRCVNSP